MRKLTMVVLAALMAVSALLAQPASAEAPSHRPLDARAAAAATPAGGGNIGTQSSWYSGAVAAGETQYWVWNNASPLLAYSVGLSPVGASTSAWCQFEVVRTRYQQQSTGERRFYFDIKNVGAVACGANILLTWSATDYLASTGGVDPGQTKIYTRSSDIFNPDPNAHPVGLATSGATSTKACQFEVTRTYYRIVAGTTQFVVHVKNVGGIACSAEVRLASVPTTVASWSLGPIESGGYTIEAWWNNANPLNLVYVPRLTLSTTHAAACGLEVTRTWYVQRINGDGSAEREFRFHVNNTGEADCSSSAVHLASIAA